MTYKSALAGVNYGGGKSVILKPKNSFNRKILFTTFGKFINKLQGQYIMAIDSGTTLDDMEIISDQTPYERVIPIKSNTYLTHLIIQR